MINFYSYYNGHLDLHDQYSELLNHIEEIAYAERIGTPINKFDDIKHIIRRDPETALIYVIHIYGKRWLEAEPVIMKHPDMAYQYAVDIIKGRWEEAEPYIRESDWIWGHYCRIFDIAY